MPEVPVRPWSLPKVWGFGGSFTGAGDTDCTLSAEQRAAGSNSAVPVSTCSSDSDGGLMAGPITSELVGMRDGSTAMRQQELPEVEGVPVTGGQWRQAEGGFDQRQAGTVLERALMDHTARVRQV